MSDAREQSSGSNEDDGADAASMEDEVGSASDENRDGDADDNEPAAVRFLENLILQLGEENDQENTGQEGDSARPVLRDDGTIVLHFPRPDLQRGEGSGSDEQIVDADEDADLQEDGEEEESGSFADEDGRALPPPKEHTYLPCAHPLFPETWVSKKRHSGVGRGPAECRKRQSRHDSGVDDFSSTLDNVELTGEGLAVTDEVVTTETLASQSVGSNASVSTFESLPDADNVIHDASPMRLLELPIIELDSVVLFPGSTLPLRLRNPDWVEYLGDKIDRARGLLGSSYGSEEVRIGVITRTPERRRRHQETGGRVGRWRTEMIRRGVGSSRRTEEQHSSGDDGDTDRNSSAMDRSRSNDSVESANDSHAAHEFQFQQPPSPPPPPADPFVGRIGCLATVTYTHEEASGAGGGDNAINVGNDNAHNQQQRSRVWRRHQGQLVVTVLGTGRFRVVSRIDGSTEDEASSRLMRGWGDMADIRVYVVERLCDESLPLPPRSLSRGCYKTDRYYVGDARDVQISAERAKSDINLMHHNAVICSVAGVSSAPILAYKLVWPWKLVHIIRSAISEIPSLSGLREKGSSDSGAGRTNDPMAFSFWMAANMALSQHEKMELLEMHCVVRRLRFILSRVEQQRLVDKPLHCQHCGAEVSTSSSMFTVGGAEGTTGAYVNEHGIIHETITVRKVVSRNVVCVGGSETKDSWFPGYSWTIAYCTVCQSHLGWKFLLVRRRMRSIAGTRADNVEKGTHKSDEATFADHDRPKIFWGLSGSSVTTEITSPRRMLRGRFQLDWFLSGDSD